MTTLVIGAGSGMGAATARRLATRGRLLLADVNGAAAEKVAAEIGGGAEAMSCDITLPDQIAALIERAGELDTLVLTAAVASGSLLPGRTILEVNLRGTARVLAAVEEILAPGACVVCFASTAGHMVPDVPAVSAVLDDPLSDRFFDDLAEVGVDLDDALTCYGYSKLGVMRHVRRLAGPWGAKGARILSLSPGAVDTPMSRAEAELHEVMHEFVRSTPLARWGRPEEVAAVVEFLTSDHAGFMTGSDVLVDGGQRSMPEWTA